MKCSVIINTYNEQNNIQFALQSIKNINKFDEIIIGDMNSSDNTVYIAEKYGAKIIKIPYDKHFDRARKTIIEAAKNEWCFLLDADEIIPNELGNLIEEVIEEDKCDVCYIPTLNYFFGVKSKYGIHFPCHHCRLFKKQYIHVTGVVHNYLNVINDARELFIEGEENSIIHFSFNNIEQWCKKRLRYIELETENNKKFKSPFFCFTKSFINAYFKEKNYKGGYDGFILSLLAGISSQLANIKNYYDNKNIDIKNIKNKYINGKK